MLKGRQLAILKVMLAEERIELDQLRERVWKTYSDLKSPWHAVVRDLNSLSTERLGLWK